LCNKLLQIYQEGSSFFQSIVEYLSNYFGSLFEDMSMLGEQLSKIVQEEMSNVTSTSVEEIYRSCDILVSEFAI
jgi:hypothetical protein